MNEKITWVLGIIVAVFVMFAVHDYATLPKVYFSPVTGEKVCAVDSSGKRIPLELVRERYEKGYSLICPGS
ncbi:TPA: hypothetical protein DCW61_01570 [Candidatus Uhrbacteria bacterium]|nr:hypothetical protein [Candidatus Uhrbacteria bacterium]